MKIVKTLFLMILFLGSCFPADAQKFLWNMDFEGFFDNREFKAPYQKPQTFFGTRLSPEIGIELKSAHQLVGGVSWLQEFGDTDSGVVDWRIYYRYNGDHLKASFGSFSRKLLIEEYPTAMFNDSMRYFDPNINGALIQYVGRYGHIEAFIDWRSRQSETSREIFTIASSGKIQKGILGGGYFFWMNHFAKSANGSDESLVDNLMINPYLTVNLDEKTLFDVMNLRAGVLASIDRNRGFSPTFYPVGFLGELRLEWRFLGVHETFYAGGNQLPLYNEFGPELHYSDPFYQAPVYSRTDIYGYLLRNKYVTCKASFNLHVAGGEVQTQQMLTLCFFIDQASVTKQQWKKIFSR